MIDDEIFVGDVVTINGFDQHFCVTDIDKLTSKVTIVTIDVNSVPHVLIVKYDCLSLVEEVPYAN